VDIAKKHVYYRSETQPGKPTVHWCIEAGCWERDPLAQALLNGPYDEAEERLCLAMIQARGPRRLLAGRDWWGPQYKPPAER
jgi:hypothetical protein